MGYIEAKEAELVPGLTIAQKLVLIGLCNRANWETQGGTTFYGQRTLAKELGMSRKTVNFAMKHLEEQGFIGRSARYRQDTMSQATRSSDLIRVNRELVFYKASEHRAALEAERLSVENAPDAVDNPVGEEPFNGVPDADNVRNLQKLSNSELHSLGNSVTYLVTESNLACNAKLQLNKEPNKELNREPKKALTPSPAGEAQRRQTLDLIQQVANSSQSIETFEQHLEETYGEEVSDYFMDYWQTIPARCTERYEAATWLNTFLNTAKTESVLPTTSEEEERNKQLSRLEELIKKSESEEKKTSADKTYQCAEPGCYQYGYGGTQYCFTHHTNQVA